MGVSLAEAVVAADFGTFSELLDPAVVWVGVYPGQLCRSRDEVLATMRATLDAGTATAPEVVAERGDLLVVDPHLDPPAAWASDLHHVFVLHDGQIVEMRDYPDRASALEAVGA